MSIPKSCRWVAGKGGAGFPRWSEDGTDALNWQLDGDGAWAERAAMLLKEGTDLRHFTEDLKMEIADFTVRENVRPKQEGFFQSPLSVSKKGGKDWTWNQFL